MRIGIMQGRLRPPEGGRFQCFPREAWQEEFAAASSAGLDAIEWIHDIHGADVNPILTTSGLARMRDLSAQSGVVVASLCADYFMDRPFVRASPAEFEELTSDLWRLIERCRIAGIERIVLPFVDNSRIETVEQESAIVELLRRTLPLATAANVELHLETSLDPQAFAAFLAQLPHPFLKVNYDSGNSSSLGYDVREELAAYGDRIGSVHIKDRVRGGGTVPLGKGDADIPTLLAGLSDLGYAGDYVLQVARGTPGDEIGWARKNREHLLQFLEASDAVPQGGI